MKVVAVSLINIFSETVREFVLSSTPMPFFLGILVPVMAMFKLKYTVRITLSLNPLLTPGHFGIIALRQANAEMSHYTDKDKMTLIIVNRQSCCYESGADMQTKRNI